MPWYEAREKCFLGDDYGVYEPGDVKWHEKGEKVNPHFDPNPLPDFEVRRRDLPGKPIDPDLIRPPMATPTEEIEDEEIGKTKQIPKRTPVRKAVTSKK